MTTLNESDLAIAPDRLSELPRLPRDEGGPVFAEPWQAQAFALAVKLSEQGHYTWKEWAAALSDNSRLPRDVVNPTTVRDITNTGWPRSRGWSLRRGWPIRARSQHEKKRGPMLIATRLTASPSSSFNRELQTCVGCLLAGSSCTLQRAWIGRTILPARVVESAFGFAGAGLGALLGMRHALEPDHLAAISTLMTGERSSARAAWLGAFWDWGTP